MHSEHKRANGIEKFNPYISKMPCGSAAGFFFAMKIVLFVLLTACLVVVLPSDSRSGKDRIVIDDFESGLKGAWEKKVFEGETIYSVVETSEGKVLRAVSNGTASGMIFKIEYDPEEYPYISWRWKVENTIKKGDARKKEGDDYAARIYVVFPHWFPPLSKSLNYIWANRLPRGESIENTYFSGAVMIAVESGHERVGDWVREVRNIADDYLAVFGKKPGKVGAIAIMTDTDQTGEKAVGYYDDIMIMKSGTYPDRDNIGKGPE